MVNSTDSPLPYEGEFANRQNRRPAPACRRDKHIVKGIVREIIFTDESEITFPMLECWNPMTRVATIAAQIDKQRVLCRISLELLQEKFQASEDEPMRAVAENRKTLQATARRLIEDRAFEEDGCSILIRRKDL